ncbi:MAG: glycosyltransferase [Alphaproteobacteria bacterium]
MAKVFVAGALLPTGGAYMAYHLGRLLARHFGYELFDIHIYNVDKRIFRYDTPIQSVSIPQMENMVTGDDILIVNPSFSQFLFGLRLPGRKIMYIQDFRTFLLMDCHFDIYVSVSSVVSRYVHALYGIESPVIPAFIQLNQMPQALPWHERPKHSALVYMKNPSHEHKVLLAHISAQLRQIAPHINLTNILEGRGLTHQEFLRRLGAVRYFVNMSLAEGFGLVPLEAMAMGTMVTGVDGLAGRDYMNDGHNCMIGSIKNLRGLAHTIADAFSDEDRAFQITQNGQASAKHYGHAMFKAAWLKQFAEFLQREPAHA